MYTFFCKAVSFGAWQVNSYETAACYKTITGAKMKYLFLHEHFYLLLSLLVLLN